MKLLALSSAIALFASNAIAGSVAYVAPAAPVMIEEPASMGGSGAWLIPLIAIAIIALASGMRNNGCHYQAGQELSTIAPC